MSIIKNKRGGEKLLSIWWFFILGIVGAFVTIGVILFFGADVDVKQVESDILNQRIVDCISHQGILRNDFLSEGFDIYSKCNLEKSVFEKDGDFYFEVNVSRGDLQLKFLQNNKNFNLKKDCQIAKAVVTKGAPKCVLRKRILENNEGQLNVEIFTLSKQEGETISILK